MKDEQGWQSSKSGTIGSVAMTTTRECDLGGILEAQEGFPPPCGQGV